MESDESDIELLHKEILKTKSYKPKKTSLVEREVSEYFAFLEEPPQGDYSVNVAPKNRIADEF